MYDPKSVLIIQIMERKILRRLDAWRTDPQRKPLIIQGARQVGDVFNIIMSPKDVQR